MAQVRRRRYALGWSESILAAKLQIAVSTSAEAVCRKSRRVFRMWMDKAFLYLAEVLRVQVQELFPTRPLGNRIYDFIEKLETTRF
jgi:hypothetical protein